MTTEVVLMNKSAVALAPDSAVTIMAPTGPKVYDSVNKLFELIKGRPVGVMVFNAAELNGVPWETIIKTYREQRRTAVFDTIDEYAADFMSWLEAADDVFPTDQDSFLLGFRMWTKAQALVGQINESIRRRLETTPKGPLPDSEVEGVVRDVILAERTRLSKIPPCPWADRLKEDAFARRHAKDITSVIKTAFQELPLGGAARTALRKVLVMHALRRPEGEPEFSGLVFAGFGQTEFFPKMRTAHIYARTDRVLQWRASTSTDISLWEPAAVTPFAQGDMVRSFTDGLQDQVKTAVLGYWQGWSDGLKARAHDTIKTRQPSLDDATSDDLAGVFADIAQDAVQGFFDTLEKHQKTSVREPVLQSLAYLPKDEMGAMAESLVNLTTLKRKVSIDEAQTVGGAVDVAIISRGDGFVWLRRKHYFEQMLNPAWVPLHTGSNPDPEEVR
jgi:hypothetical protein